VAHNWLSGIIALAKVKIGREIKAAKANGELAKPGTNQHDLEVVPDGNNQKPATLTEVGLTRKQSSDYQRKAEVEEGVLLAAIAAAGAEGREVTRSTAATRAGVPRPASP
jgi:hypothetical protein